jgi:2-hydroxy-3-oxopropionate reductase
MKKIGFIGLGIMGSHMAANLIRAGYDVTGYDVVPESVDWLLQAGWQACPQHRGGNGGG